MPDCKLARLPWKTVWQFLKKLKIEQSYDLAIYTFRNTLSHKDIYVSTFTAELLTIAKTWKQSKGPLMDKWMKEMSHTHIHTHNVIFRHKKKILPLMTTSIDLEGIMPVR